MTTHPEERAQLAQVVGVLANLAVNVAALKLDVIADAFDTATDVLIEVQDPTGATFKVDAAKELAAFARELAAAVEPANAMLKKLQKPTSELVVSDKVPPIRSLKPRPLS